MIILVDMDGVLADFRLGFYEKAKDLLPDTDWDNFLNHHSYNLYDAFPEKEWKTVYSILHSENLFLELPGIERSIEHLKKLAEKYTVFICTSPLITNVYCAKEKLEWVEKHLGEGWAKRTIITKDKTLVKGDFLIDDKPEVTGVIEKPEWEHIVFDTSYSKHVLDKRRLESDWKNVEDFFVLHS